jgi:hypothetical protein
MVLFLGLRKVVDKTLFVNEVNGTSHFFPTKKSWWSIRVLVIQFIELQMNKQVVISID